MNAASPLKAPPPGARADWTIDQDWRAHGEAEHAVWTTLYERQSKLLPGRACDAFLRGLDALDLHRGGIPEFARINLELGRLTGWSVVAVPGLVPDAVFFEHLAIAEDLAEGSSEIVLQLAQSGARLAPRPTVFAHAMVSIRLVRTS